MRCVALIFVMGVASTAEQIHVDAGGSHSVLPLRELEPDHPTTGSFFFRFDVRMPGVAKPWDTYAQIAVAQIAGRTAMAVLDYGDAEMNGALVNVADGCEPETTNENPGSEFRGSFLLVDKLGSCSALEAARKADSLGVASILVSGDAASKFRALSSNSVNVLVGAISVADNAAMSKRLGIIAEQGGSGGSGALWAQNKQYKKHMAKQLHDVLLDSSKLKPPVPLTIDNVRVVVVLFYGRKPSVEILNVYLQRNLRRCGGIIDEIQFIVNTDTPRDLEYLDELLATEPEIYKRAPYRFIKNANKKRLFGRYYTLMTDPSTVYIKLDDDMVYVADGAFEALVEEKLTGSHLFVSANVANHPILGFTHQRLGAIKDFEVTPRVQLPNGTVSQRYSARLVEDEKGRERHHRVFERDPEGPCSLLSWECAAVVHESFLQAYEAEGPSGGEASIQQWMFDVHDLHGDNSQRQKQALIGGHSEVYPRWSINVMAMQPKDWRLLDQDKDLADKLLKDDEFFLSAEYPEFASKNALSAGQPQFPSGCVAKGAAMMVHYGYGPQQGGLDTYTEGFLARYKAISETRKGCTGAGTQAKPA